MARRAFTLIELLVVMAIIVLLIATLIQALSGARDRARTVLCASNMRTIGQLVHDWATEHDDRAPGTTQRDSPTNSSYTWENILNDFYMRSAQENPFRTRIGTIELMAAPASRTLTCPKFVVNAGGGGSHRQYALNGNVCGGTRSAAMPAGPYGMLVIPSPQLDPPNPGNIHITEWDASNPTKTGWVAGAKLQWFASSQWMLVEQEHSVDAHTGPTGSSSNGSVTLGGGGGYPAYSTLNDGYLAFRHPYYRGANFLAMDGHVEVRGPTDDVADNSSAKRTSHFRPAFR
jgi:prepilin-type N-terminal cleavage/methylation domain-containing protein/prepilin-type processing-associated H-X9-DG protein